MGFGVGAKISNRQSSLETRSGGLVPPSSLVTTVKLVPNLRLRAEDPLLVSDRREASIRCVAGMVANGKAATVTV